jgi:hypothetical protein
MYHAVKHDAGGEFYGYHDDDGHDNLPGSNALACQ